MKISFSYLVNWTKKIAISKTLLMTAHFFHLLTFSLENVLETFEKKNNGQFATHFNAYLNFLP